MPHTKKVRISMNLLRFRQAAPMVMALFLIRASFAQATGGDKVDLDSLAQIKTEAFEHSQVMENLFWMSEVYGPRVTNSRNHKLAAEWAMKQMQEWGLKNVHLEKWRFGYGWQIKHFYAAMETPVYAAFTGFPLAWTPGTNGPITVEGSKALGSYFTCNAFPQKTCGRAKGPGRMRHLGFYFAVPLNCNSICVPLSSFTVLLAELTMEP
jgi:hypothetical protein